MTNATCIESVPNETTSRLTHADLYQFTGDIVRFVHPINRKVIYTPGVQYVAQAGHAYWLVDAIASYFGTEQMSEAMRLDNRLKSLQFWKLDVSEQSAVLIAEADAGVEPFIRQEIPYTDFPLDHVEIWAGFDGNYWTLYLPSEH